MSATANCCVNVAEKQILMDCIMYGKAELKFMKNAQRAIRAKTNSVKCANGRGKEANARGYPR